jgi:hypothetical protein
LLNFKSNKEATILEDKSFLRSMSTSSSRTTTITGVTNPSTKIKTVKNSPISRVTSSYLVIKQRRRKILVLIATVSITFAVLWLPVHIIQLWMVVFSESFPYTDLMYIIKLISHTLSYSNSCFNPFIYVFMGTKFRTYFAIELRNFKNSLTCAKNISKSNDSIMFYQNSRVQRKNNKASINSCNYDETTFNNKNVCNKEDNIGAYKKAYLKLQPQKV